MATIVNFKPADSSSHRETVRRESSACEIILFPGVRYERWAETHAETPKTTTSGKKPRAKKRKLEMAD